IGQELRLPENTKPVAAGDTGKPDSNFKKSGDAPATEPRSEKALTNEKEFVERHPNLSRAPERIKSDYHSTKQGRDGKIDEANSLIQKSNELTREQFKSLGLTDEDAKKPGAVEARLKELRKSNDPDDLARAERVLKLQEQIDGNGDKVRQL